MSQSEGIVECSTMQLGDCAAAALLTTQVCVRNNSSANEGGICFGFIGLLPATWSLKCASTDIAKAVP